MQFRNFQDSQCLTFMDNITDVHIDPLHVATHLRMYIDNLIWLKLSGYSQHMRDVASLHRRDLCSWNLCGTRLRISCFGSTGQHAKRSRERQTRRESHYTSLSHVSNAP